MVLTGSSSTSTLRNMTLGNFLANSAKNGAINRQGPHHEAVKSTTICIKRSHRVQTQLFGEYCKKERDEEQDVPIFSLRFLCRVHRSRLQRCDSRRLFPLLPFSFLYVSFCAKFSNTERNVPSKKCNLLSSTISSSLYIRAPLQKWRHFTLLLYTMLSFS